MGAEPRPRLSGPGQFQIEDVLRALLGVHPELETLLQERAHHQSHLILGGLTIRPRFDVESLVVDPSREAQQITRSQPIGKAQVGDERLVGGAEPATVGGIRVSGAEREERRGGIVRPVRFDGRDLEGGVRR